MNRIISKKRVAQTTEPVVVVKTLEDIEKEILIKKEAREKERFDMIEKIRIDTRNTMIDEKNKIKQDRLLEYNNMMNMMIKPKIIRKKNNSTQTDITGDF